MNRNQKQLLSESHFLLAFCSLSLANISRTEGIRKCNLFEGINSMKKRYHSISQSVDITVLNTAMEVLCKGIGLIVKYLVEQ